MVRLVGSPARLHIDSFDEKASKALDNFDLSLDLGLTRFRGPIRVKRSSSMKGVEEDGQERQALLA